MSKKHAKKRAKQLATITKLPNFDDETKTKQNPVEEEVVVPSSSPVYEVETSETDQDIQEAEQALSAEAEQEVAIEASEGSVDATAEAEIAEVSYDGVLEDAVENKNEDEVEDVQEDMAVEENTRLSEEEKDVEDTSADNGVARDRGDSTYRQSDTGEGNADSGTFEAKKAAPNLADDTEVADDAEEISAELAHEKNTSLEGDLAEVQSDIKADEIGRVLNYEPRSHVFRKIVIAIVSILILILVAAVTALVLNETHVFDLLDQKGDNGKVDEAPAVGELPLAVEYVAILNQDGEVATEILEYDLASASDMNFRIAKEMGETFEKLELEAELMEADYSVEDLGETLEITLKREVLQKLAAGEHEVIITLKNGETERKLGVRFVVKGELKCQDGQELKDGTCVEVKKPTTEQPKAEQTAKPMVNNSQSGNNGTGANNSASTDGGASAETPSSGSNSPTTIVGEKSEEQRICENQTGPVGVVTLHWQNEGDEIDWQYTRFATNARMLWRNNSCTPSIIYSAKAGVEGGSGERINTSDSQLTAFVNNYLSTLQNNAKTDIVIWLWDASDFSKAKFDYVSDALAVRKQ